MQPSKEEPEKRMTHPVPHEKYQEHVHLSKTSSASPVDETFLSQLVDELDNETVTALILKGSYARGDATSFSDVDLTRFVKEAPEPTQQKQFTYREGRLLSISTRTLAQERERLTRPESAIFVVPSLREARILLDKDGAFRALQQEALAFTWEPLQEAANSYASAILMEHTDHVHKILRGLFLHDDYALSEIALELLFAVTDAVAIQRGMLVRSGNTWFRQVQELVDLHSAWTHYHRLLAGMDTHPLQRVSLEMRGVAALRLYQETVKLLRLHLPLPQREVIEQAVRVIDSTLSSEEVS